MNDEDIITIRGLRNSFGEQVIHSDLDLDVRKGEILGVVGGSGTGKSVLMRSIIGLQTPDEGEIEVLGENMIGRNDDEAKNIRRRWGILFQNGALFSTLTVAENVEVPIREYFPYLKPPILDEIAGEHSDKLRIVKLNVDENPRTAATYGVTSIPTMNVYHNGQVVKTIVGAKPKAMLLKDLEAFL